jgi:tetratricopeptide (TPR) repeat protein
MWQLLAIAVVAAMLPAHADDLQDCNNQKDPALRLQACMAAASRACNQDKDSALQIRACTGLIAVYGNRAVYREELSKALTNRGIGYSNKHDPERALADYNEAVHLDPKNGLAFFNRAMEYNNMRKFDRAIADYDEAIKLLPRFVRAYIYRAQSKMANGDIVGAKEDVGTAIDLGARPDDFKPN